MRKFPLALISVLVAGCPTSSKDDSSGDIFPEDDPPCEREAETGIGQLYFIGGFEVPAGEFESGYFGMGMRKTGTGDWLCEVTGAIESAGDAPAGCPDCEWSFTSEPISGSTATGDRCADFGLADGSVDGWSDGYGWGYASAYPYEYGSNTYYFDSALMMYLPAYPDYGWFMFGSNYAGYRTWVYGDAESFTFARPAFSGGAYVYYYYYTGEYSYDPEGCTYVE